MKQIKKLIYLACLMALVSSLFTGVFVATPAFASTAWFTGAGTWYWTCPAYVYSVKVEVWGAGGSGANGVGSSQAGGGSGGGGAYSRLNSYSVTPGGNYTIVVGAGGLGVSTAATWGNDGGDSYFVSPSVCLAKGGKRGQIAGFPYKHNPSGAGGLASEGVGDVKYSGGTSPNGLYHQPVGGGSAAGDSQDGHAGGYPAGGVAGYEHGGIGGDGAAVANYYTGTTPGFPGGGAGGGAWGAANLKAGASGEVKLTFAYDDPGDPQCVAETLDATDVRQTTAKLWGNITYDGNQTCIGYFEWLKVGDLILISTEEVPDLHTGNLTSFDLEGLEPDVEYWYRFTIYNSETQDSGGLVKFRTGSNNIEALARGSFDVTDTSATLMGEVAQAGNYTEWSCGRFYYTDGIMQSWTECQSGMYNDLEVYAAIGNLTPDTTYTWMFLVQTEMGYDYSWEMTFHTLDRTTNTAPRVVTNIAELSQWFVDGGWVFGFKFKGMLVDDGGLDCTYGFEYRGNGTGDDWTSYDVGRRAYQGEEFWAYKFGFTRGVVIEYRATCINTVGRGYGEARVIELPAVGPMPTVSPTPPGIELPPWLKFPFTINQTVKTILGIIITLIGMVLIVAMIRTSGGLFVAAAFGLGMTIVFTVIGWYSLWIILLIGAIVGLITFLILLGKR